MSDNPECYAAGTNAFRAGSEKNCACGRNTVAYRDEGRRECELVAEAMTEA